MGYSLHPEVCPLELLAITLDCITLFQGLDYLVFRFARSAPFSIR